MLRKFYQKLLMKFCRDLRLYDDAEGKTQDLFDSIDEDEDDLASQKFFKRNLNKIDIQGKLIEFVNKYFGMKSHAEAIKEKFIEAGMFIQEG